MTTTREKILMQRKWERVLLDEARRVLAQQEHVYQLRINLEHDIESARAEGLSEERISKALRGQM